MRHGRDRMAFVPPAGALVLFGLREKNPDVGPRRTKTSLSPVTTKEKLTERRDFTLPAPRPCSRQSRPAAGVLSALVPRRANPPNPQTASSLLP